MKNNYKTKKIIAIVISIIVVICLAFGIWFVVQKNANKWELKQSELTLEYGEVYEPVLSDLVDASEYPNVTDGNTEIKVIATRDGENEYITVGEHEINIVHQIEYKLFGMTLFKSNDTKTIKIIVKDTIAPVFAEDAPTELETYKDCEIENIEEKFTASDKATITISIDKENIDYATVGEYTTNVYATDASGNVTNKEIKIKVLEPTVELDKTTSDATVGESVNISATVKGKDQTITWTSSDESIATVENGTVIAKNAGKVTITAKANSVEATCEITVKAKSVVATPSNNGRNNNNSKPSSNSSNSSSSSNGNSSSSSSSNSGGGSTASSGCASGNHSMGVGNIGRWFNSRSEVDAYFSSTCTKWKNKHQAGEITWEEYTKNCPQGYKSWSCSSCGKWTGNFTY